MTDNTVKPHAIESGYPKEEMNGLFGSEEWLIEHVGETVTVVAVLDIKDVIEKRLAGEEYPLLKWKQLEPIRSETAEKTALDLMRDAKAGRKNATELDIPADPPASPAGGSDLEAPAAAFEGDEVSPGKPAQWDDTDKAGE